MSGSFLLDTSILSLLAPGRIVPPEVDQWFRQNDGELLVSVITIGEIEQGISKLRRSGGVHRATLYGAWLDSIIEAFADRVMPLDTLTARLAGVLSDRAISIGRHPGPADVLIAATALHREATVVTRNVRHFAPLGVDILDPFDTPPTRS